MVTSRFKHSPKREAFRGNFLGFHLFNRLIWLRTSPVPGTCQAASWHRSPQPPVTTRLSCATKEPRAAPEGAARLEVG